jgi:hypothetical protein
VGPCQPFAQPTGRFVGSVGRSEHLTELRLSKLCRSPKQRTVAWYKCRPVASPNHCQPQEEPITSSQISPQPVRLVNGFPMQYFAIYVAIDCQELMVYTFKFDTGCLVNCLFPNLTIYLCQKSTKLP